MDKPNLLSQQTVIAAQLRSGWFSGLIGLVIFTLLGLGFWLFSVPPPSPQARVVALALRSESPAAPENTLAAGFESPSVTGDRQKSVEVCGLGSFNADTDEDSVRKTHASAITAAKEANFQALLTSVDPATRAAGLVMRMADIAQQGAIARYAATVACEAQRKRNGGTFACALPRSDGAAIVAEQRAAFAPWVQKLAAIAVTSKDPAVVAQAVRACEGQTALQACSTLTFQHWARLDPGNLAPWIFVLNNARERQDTAGVNEALHQMSVSKFSKAHEFFAWTRFASETDTGTDLQRLVSVDQMGALHLLHSFDIGGLLDECNKPRVIDANRRQLCDSIATVMVEKGDTYFLTSMGIGLGQRAGWPIAKLAAIHAEKLAIQQSHTEAASAFFQEDGAQKLDCQSVDRTRSLMRVMGQQGELASARGLAKANGFDITAKAQLLFPAEWQRLEQEALHAQQRR